MIPYHRIASLLYNAPLLLTPEKAQIISAYLWRRIESQERVSRFVGSVPVDEETGKQAPYKVSGQTAIVPIIGELVNRGAWLGASSGLVSYEGLQYQISRALQDDSVKSILLDINSPGGEASGAFETADFIRAVNNEKLVVAFVNSMAASGGYALASGAGKIVAIPSSVLGSIGVYYMHLDISQALAKEGIKPTVIFEGAHKIDGNPWEPLPKDVRADIQAKVAKTYLMFVDTVARGRGHAGLTAGDIRDTEARVYTGAEAVRLGLADQVGTFAEVLSELEAA